MSGLPVPQPEIEQVQHPIMGPLKFPKDMPYDQRNQIISDMEKERNLTGPNDPSGTYDFGDVGKVSGMRTNGQPATRQQALDMLVKQRGMGQELGQNIQRKQQDISSFVQSATSTDQQTKTYMGDLAQMAVLGGASKLGSAWKEGAMPPPAVNARPPIQASAPVASPAVTPAAATQELPTALGSTLPRTPSGEAVLNQVLTSLDNKSLLKVARSRGIDVSAEAQLKPGVANSKLVRKIINDFSTDELAEAQNQGLELSRNIPVGSTTTPEAYQFKVLQTFFPDVSIPKALQARAQASIAQRPTTAAGGNIVDLLTKSIEMAKKK